MKIGHVIKMINWFDRDNSKYAILIDKRSYYVNGVTQYNGRLLFYIPESHEVVMIDTIYTDLQNTLHVFIKVKRTVTGNIIRGDRIGRYQIKTHVYLNNIETK